MTSCHLQRIPKTKIGRRPLRIQFRRTLGHLKRFSKCRSIDQNVYILGDRIFVCRMKMSGGLQPERPSFGLLASSRNHRVPQKSNKRGVQQRQI
ncbi:hypothetical protein BTM_5972 (plasmid) [Burkholderia thailandensis 34]|nr:hypothetical protein BTM_5972 [Burkholderia thailandensis 34]